MKPANNTILKVPGASGLRKADNIWSCPEATAATWQEINMTGRLVPRLFVCSLVTLLGSGCLNLNQTSAKPKAYLEKTAFNVAVITDKTTGPREFDIPVFNAGDKPLKLEYHDSTCGCVQVISYDAEIVSKDMGTIRVSVDPNSGSYGSSVQWLSFKTNDPTLSSLRIQFFYDIASKSIAFSPSVVDLETTKEELLQQKSIEAGTVWIRDMSSELLSMEHVEFSNPNFGHTLYDVVYTCRSGIKSHRVRLNIYVDSEMPAGEVNESMKLYTNNSEFPLIEVPIRGFIKPRVEVSPASILLRNLMPGQEVEREILVRTTQGTLTIENVQLKHSWLKVIEVVEKEKESIICVGGKVPPRPPIGPCGTAIEKTELKIEIREPDPYVASVEVFAFLANSN